MRKRLKVNGDCERAREVLREGGSVSAGACDADFPRLLASIVRPRDSFSLSLSGGATPVALWFVLCLERDKDESPPIIELNDILLKEPEALPPFISGAFKPPPCWAEFVLSRALRISCEAWLSSSCSVLIKVGVSNSDEDQRRGVVGLETGAESSVTERTGVLTPLVEGVGTVESVGLAGCEVAGLVGVVMVNSFPSCGEASRGTMMLFILLGRPPLLPGLPPLLPGLPLLLPGLGMYFAVQLRFFVIFSAALMRGRNGRDGKDDGDRR